MKPLYRIALVAAILHPFACGAYGQAGGTGSGSVQSTNNHPVYTARLAPPHHGPVVTGAPYSAEQVFDQAQTLADGTHITQKTLVTKLFRDSQGRTRKERPIFRVMNSTFVPMIVEIVDPVSGFRYILDPYNHIAHRFAPSEGAKGPARYVDETPAVTQGAKPTPTLHAAIPAQPQTDRPEVSTEPLGSQIIEAVNAEGQKTTTTFPIGMMGNDRPLVGVTESWFSPELRITVMTKHSDPRMGESVTQLRNIERSEPDPALFSVPPDYQVVDENGEAEIKIVRP